MVKILNKENSILNKFLSQMRDKHVQGDSMRFRRNMERVGEIMAYEISKRLNYTTRMVETPLGIAAVEEISDKVVIATILRAGLPSTRASSTTSTMPTMALFRHTAKAVPMVASS